MSITPLSVAVIGAGMAGTTHANAWRQVGTVFDLGLPPVSIRVNNRKLSEGFYRGLGIEDTAAVLQRVDKYDKVGPDVVAELLTERFGPLDEAVTQRLASASLDELKLWSRRILSAQTLDEVFRLQ